MQIELKEEMRTKQEIRDVRWESLRGLIAVQLLSNCPKAHTHSYTHK